MTDTPRQISPRAAAASILFQVVEQGQSLSQLLPKTLARVAPRDQALVQEICFGCCRWLPRLEFVLQQLMASPLKGKQRVGHFLLMVGVYQLYYLRTPAHAAVSETVQASSELKLKHLKKLLNGVLRNAERQKDALEEKLQGIDKLQSCHPSWLLTKLQQAYPQQWQDIVNANNQRAPMWLRVNQQHHKRDDYQARLAELDIISHSDPKAANALRLEHPTAVQNLPGFAEGHSSVQDAAAQMAAQLLDVAAGDRVLDACAAPGGKTCHLLESQPQLSELLAIDSDAQRLSRVKENLERIGLQATLLCADASQPDSWNQQAFDKILLDAPCSATGVIRRHPDIKWLRRAADIAQLVELQGRILQALWQHLTPGGVLLYATCSILPEENSQQVAKFLANNSDAQLLPILAQETPQQPGWQLLPGQEQRDGFYYARLKKHG